MGNKKFKKIKLGEIKTMGKEIWGKDKVLHVVCDCNEELIQVVSNSDEKEIYMSFFKLANNKSFGFWHNLRLIWKIMTTGTPYNDMVCLNYTEAKQLVGFLREEIPAEIIDKESK